ncbi:MAG TPA: NADP-dependent isocitrate dehydrogenase [Thermotogaceae bacterium]|nr:NADP-dependent isocitrate dehydrogenase [Thermotogaceae bacterium]
MAEKIKFIDGKLFVPVNPEIIFIRGDGIGPEIMEASMLVWNAAVERIYRGKRRIYWKEVLIGERALKEYGTLLPDETIREINDHVIAIKSPVKTPVGGGYKSLNVELRKIFDLYANIRPVKWIEGIPSPLKNPENIDLVIFRENTEDVYIGLEWESTDPQATKIREFFRESLKVNIREDAGIALKTISEFATKRLVRKAVEYAIENNRRKITIVHKGNIMKYTEGAFLKWALEVLEEEFGNITATGKEEGRITFDSRIADDMFQQLILHPQKYDILIAPNLNGDYLSDAAAALVGGLGIAPGMNIGDKVAIFEAVHGTAPDIAGKNIANPLSLIFSGALMFKYMGWGEVAQAIESAAKETIRSQKVTLDLAEKLDVEPLGTMEFAQEIVKALDQS